MSAAPEIGQAKLFELEATSLTLADRFLIPPFSVLDARAGYWQRRKREWIDIGIRSELGRDEKLLGFESIVDTDLPCPTCAGTGISEAAQTCRDCKGNGKKYGGYGALGTTSVFDPVVCELVYRWFCPTGGKVLDPFAGGSVRGVVAAHLGLDYLGIDLRDEQVQANGEQGRTIGAAFAWPQPPRWLAADSRELGSLLGAGGYESFDLVFTCPPYFDLEVYSDDPRDLSNAGDYAAFSAAYQTIIAFAVASLKPARFIAIVVGEVRGKDGNYVGLVPDTIRWFAQAGAALYNEAILVTPLGSAPVRTSAQFGAGRKLGKTHQNLLVFCKGDPKAAAAALPLPEEVAIEQGGATWKADGTAWAPDGTSTAPDARLA